MLSVSAFGYMHVTLAFMVDFPCMYVLFSLECEQGVQLKSIVPNKQQSCTCLQAEDPLSSVQFIPS